MIADCDESGSIDWCNWRQLLSGVLFSSFLIFFLLISKKYSFYLVVLQSSAGLVLMMVLAMVVLALVMVVLAMVVLVLVVFTCWCCKALLG